MSDIDPKKKLDDALECITEAARLHILLGENATETAVAAALRWRYGLSMWSAEATYKHCLVLLDKMPECRR